MTFKEKIYQNFVRDLGTVLKGKVDNIELTKLIFLCIGTDRIIGDSFGPLVGYKLKNLFYGENNIEVIGDLENAINLSNIEQIIKKIYNTYETPFVIAIDAAVSNKIQTGRIVVENSKMDVAGGFVKRKILVGDISIKGVVSRDLKKAEHNFRLLKNAPLNLIMNMADCTVQGIKDIINV